MVLQVIVFSHNLGHLDGINQIGSADPNITNVYYNESIKSEKKIKYDQNVNTLKIKKAYGNMLLSLTCPDLY